MIKVTSLYRPNVGVMVINQAGKVLVCRRSDVDPADNPWQMVQGGIDEGETYLKAGLRELEEETNINSDEIEMVELWDEFQYYDFPMELKTPYDEIIGQKQKWLVVKYLKDDNSIDLSLAKDKEFNDYKWVSISEAVNLIWKPKKAIYKRLQERYSIYLSI
jgi:putative (di)nucleoside polyphosphate hydrolase